jgi:hypothetical protein
VALPNALGGRLITPIRAGMRDERQLYAIDPEGNSFRLIEVIAAPIFSLPIPMRLSVPTPTRTPASPP